MAMAVSSTEAPKAVAASAPAKLVVAATLLAGACLSGAASAACPPAQPQIEVEGVRGEVRELSDVTLAELATVARGQFQPPRHPLLGVYTSSIGITLRIEDMVIDVSDGLRCTAPEVVHVRLTLMDRTLHLPRDFASNSCLLELSRSHERKHADADDALFERLMASYPEDLRIRFGALVLEPAPSEAAARQRMRARAQSVVEQQLDRYTDAQASLMGEVVDTPEEVARLIDVCEAALLRSNEL